MIIASIKKYIFLIFIFYQLFASAQSSDSITLYQCLDLSIQNYPLLKQKNILENGLQLKKEYLEKNYLPQFNIIGQSTYQSDVTKININIPNINIPEPSKDQYKVLLDASQLLFDGGTIRSQMNLETANSAIEQQSVEVELYKLKNIISQLYFNILLGKENLELLKIADNELQSQEQKLKAALANGTTLTYNLLQLSAERTKLQQQMIEVEYVQKASLRILSIYTGKSIDNAERLILPSIFLPIIKDTLTILRPEIVLFRLQQEKILQSNKLINKKQMPKLYAFGQLGYGRPGFNMFTDKFDPFYIVGVKMQWNIWNWRQTNTEVKLMNIQRELINIQEEIFRLKLKTNFEKDLSNIEKFKQLLAKDKEIIDLKNEAIKTTTSQLENGIITPTEYLTDFNSLLQAKLKYKQHQINLYFSQWLLLYNLGQEQKN